MTVIVLNTDCRLQTFRKLIIGLAEWRKPSRPVKVK